MKTGTAADFLIRAVLDETFRELAIADPQRAFEGYDLSPDQRESLRRRDGRVLGLRGEVVAPPDEERPASAAQPPLPKLPEVTLLLRLTPQSAQLPDSTSKVTYAAALSTWPGNEEIKNADGEPSDVAWVIRITPTVLERREEGWHVAYAAVIQPLAVDLAGSSLTAQEKGASPWNHQVESDAAKMAAQAVLTSGADGRYARLLDLVHALQPGNERD
ncbi:MAG: hypothetical protein IID33_10060 [Planctomycetes bacterium]|nr:hypothetical protein [Planctomycetota bacterium]